MCLALATVLFICVVPARLIEMSVGDFEDSPGDLFFIFFVTRLLIHAQPILFAMVCTSYYPTFYEGLRKYRLWRG